MSGQQQLQLVYLQSCILASTTTLQLFQNLHASVQVVCIISAWVHVQQRWQFWNPKELGYTVLYSSCLQKKLLTDQYHHSTSVQNSLLFQSVLFPTLPTHIHGLLDTYTIIHLHCFTNNCKHCPLLKWNILTYAFLEKGQTQKDFSTLQSMYQTEQPPMQSTQHSQAQHTQSNTPAAYSTCL